MAESLGERGAKSFAGAGEPAFESFLGKVAGCGEHAHRLLGEVFFLQKQPVVFG